MSCGVDMDPMERTSTNTLFLALTRPAMVMGVTMEAFYLNLIIALCAFLLTKNIFFGFLWVPLHMVCVVLCRIDKRFFTIFLCNTRLGKTRNTRIWKGESYEPY
jgi:type IV secretion system protein VirB3